eukprot:tig00000079_g2792.t1
MTQRAAPRADGVVEHPVSAADTLLGLSLCYNVPVAQIRQANGLSLGASPSTPVERLTFKKKLIIPSNGSYVPPRPEVLEALRQSKALRQFGEMTGADVEEAKFYCSNSNYDAAKAAAEYKEDKAWENSKQNSRSEDARSSQRSSAATNNAPAPPSSVLGEQPPKEIMMEEIRTKAGRMSPEAEPLLRRRAAAAGTRGFSD